MDRKMTNIFFIGAYCCVWLITARAQKVVESIFIRNYGGCDIKSTLLHLERLAVNLTGKGITKFSGHIYADEDLDRITMLSLRVNKCTHFDDRDSGGCEYYTTLKYPNPCEQVILAKTMPWSPLFNTKPPLSCPIKKGNYTLQPSSINPSEIRAPAGLYWQFVMKLYTGNKVVSCVKGGVEKMATRIRQKSKGV